jgi:hypothetical protein
MKSQAEIADAVGALATLSVNLEGTDKWESVKAGIMAVALSWARGDEGGPAAEVQQMIHAGQRIAFTDKENHDDYARHD